MATLIKATDISKVYHKTAVPVHALNHVNLTVREGEFTAIVGPSGCGKTTLLNILGGLDHSSSGKVEIAGTDITTMQDSRLIDFRLHNIGFVFQAYNLIPVLTARENVEFIMLLLKRNKKEREERAKQLLHRMDMSDKLHHRPAELSGGQQQRVAISRAIVAKPKVILADEPTGNLDSANGEEVMKLLSQLNEEGTTIVMVTHSPYDANYAHRIVNLFDGKVVTENIKEHFHI